MIVSLSTRKHLNFPPLLTWPVLVSGMGAAFATYWDEAWHTDVGRDTAWSAPHLLLYGSIAVVGVSVAVWGVAQLIAARSLRRTLGNRPLLAAGAGALSALVAAPIDAYWHHAYGRDAVLWSPPHILALFGAVGLVLGVAAGLPDRLPAARLAAGVLFLGNAVAVVFEYETDVPQFSEVFYLALLAPISVWVAWTVQRLVPRRGAVTVVVLGYVGIRLLVMVGLAMMGRSVPDLPIAIMGLALWDLPSHSQIRRVAAAVAGVSALALVASWTDLASQPVAEIALVAIPLLALSTVVLSRSSIPTATAAVAVLAAIAVSLAPQAPAQAHDPGQGDPVVSIRLAATVHDAEISVTAEPVDHCDDLLPLRVLARRAGETRVGDLRTVGDCSFAGAVDVTTGGRWFTYVEFMHEDRRVEAWLPVDADSTSTHYEDRDLYLPAGEGDNAGKGQVLLGVLTYLLGLAVIGLGWSAVSGGGSTAGGQRFA